MDASSPDGDRSALRAARSGVGWSSRRRRGALATGLVTVIAAGIALLELFVLEGETVFDQRIGSGRDLRVELPLVRAGEPHLLRIYCRRKNKLAITLAAPDGEQVAEVDEWTYHKTHFVEFTPKVAGTYVLAGTQRFRSTRSTSPRVQVFVNDRRWFGPWIYALGI